MTAIYVAAKFEDAKLARYVMDVLEAEGYDITHDWTDESVEGLSGTEVSDVLQSAAVADIAGVQNADAVVLVHHEKLWGACWEAGAALGLDKPVIAIGAPQTPNRIFYWHPDVLHVPHLDGALALLKTLFPDCGCAECEEDFGGDVEIEEMATPPEASCPCLQCNPASGVFMLDLSKVGIA
jgi:hypothetical protein